MAWTVKRRKLWHRWLCTQSSPQLFYSHLLFISMDTTVASIHYYTSSILVVSILMLSFISDDAVLCGSWVDLKDWPWLWRTDPDSVKQQFCLVHTAWVLRVCPATGRIVLPMLGIFHRFLLPLWSVSLKCFGDSTASISPQPLSRGICE